MLSLFFLPEWCQAGMRVLCCLFFFFKQKTAYEIRLSLVGSEMCIRDRMCTELADCKRSLTFANVPRSMIRGGLSSGRIARLLVCAFVALAALAPATASGQPAVDEYTLDIPQAGGGGSD